MDFEELLDTMKDQVVWVQTCSVIEHGSLDFMIHLDANLA